MKRAVINTPFGVYGKFEGTDEEIQKYRDRVEQGGPWGKPQREVTEGQEDVSGAISQREETLEDGTVVTLYTLPAEYEVVEEDLTAEIEEREQKKKQKELDEVVRKAARKRLMETDVSKLNSVAELKAAIIDIRTIISKWE